MVVDLFMLLWFYNRRECKRLSGLNGLHYTVISPFLLPLSIYAIPARLSLCFFLYAWGGNWAGYACSVTGEPIEGAVLLICHGHVPPEWRRSASPHTHTHTHTHHTQHKSKKFILRNWHLAEFNIEILNVILGQLDFTVGGATQHEIRLATKMFCHFSWVKAFFFTSW